MTTAQNLFADLAPILSARGTEAATDLFSRAGVRIERIVSYGGASPADGGWYDPVDTEWVAVLAGRAELAFADEAAPRRLGPGDWVLIPAHSRHRVTTTAPNEPTVWLAVHVSETAST